MKIGSQLDENEFRSLIHLIRNNKKLDFLDRHHSNSKNKELAKQVEKENFEQKNRFRLDKRRLDYADKKRLAVDEKKMVDVLKHHDEFR